MSLCKKLCAVICSLQISVFSISAVFGGVYKDIPSDHWAYTSIESLYSKGYLKDFTAENFNPDSYIDKFTIAKILSVAAGYTDGGDYSSKNDIIKKYSEKFTRWRNQINDRIAFLLTKNILLEEDLDSFMLFSDDGSEKFRAISREEMAVFLVRLMGKTDEAKAFEGSSFFKDDTSITASRKGCINYLKSINILNGNAQGLCSPQSAVTKAEFCVLLNNVTEFMANKASQNTGGLSSPNINNVSSTSGIIVGYFPNLRLVQIKSGGVTTPYRLNENSKITLDSTEVTKESIKLDMPASATIINSEITELVLSSGTDKTPSAGENSPSGENTVLCSDSHAKGTIQQIKINSSVKDEFLISIYSDDKIKSFSATRYTIPIYALKTGDVIEVDAEDGKISKIKITEKNNKNVTIGYITEMDDDEITVEDYAQNEKTYYYSETLTECFDCTSGEKIDFDDIKKYTEVYILCEDSSSRKIDVIFVINN